MSREQEFGASAPLRGRLLPDDLLDDRFDTAVLATVDVYGRLVGKRMSPRTLNERITRGIHASTMALAFDLNETLPAIKVPFAGLHTGWHDFVIRPDVSTLRVAGWAERSAICIGDPVDGDGGLTPIAPRAILQGQIAALAEMGLIARVSTELEFHLFRTSYDVARRADYRGLEPTTMSHAAYTIQHGEELEPFFRPAREALAASGLPIEFSNPEWGFGQWEMNREPDEPLAMADGHALFKLGLKRLASRAGLAATFMARPSSESPMGSSCHIHISLADADGHSILFDPNRERGIAPRLLHSVGGVLERGPELALFYAPTVNSYRRGFASYGWGFDNRVVQCRVVGEDAASMRFEYRIPGADANPHLALSALLGSIIDGLQRQVDPGSPYEGTSEPGPDERFPRTLEQASDRFAASDFVRRCFGTEVVDHYTSVARHEVRMFNDAVTDWEKHRYFETV